MKIQTAFQLDEKLVEKLKIRAERDNRSLNNLVETILLKDIENHESFDFDNELKRSVSGEELLNKVVQHIKELPWEK